MNESEIIKKIAEAKQARASELKIDKNIEMLLFGSVRAKYWSNWQNSQPEEWTKRLFETLKLTTLNSYKEGDKENELECYEFIFIDHSFIFKTTKFRNAWWDSEDNTLYADLHVIYDGKEVASFGLIQDQSSQMGLGDPQIISIDSFIEGNWVNSLQLFLTKALSFCEWDQNQSKLKNLEKETAELRNKFGITDEEILHVSSSISNIHSALDKIHQNSKFEIEIEQINKNNSYALGFSLSRWIKKYPVISATLVLFIIIVFTK